MFILTFASGTSSVAFTPFILIVVSVIAAAGTKSDAVTINAAPVSRTTLHSCCPILPVNVHLSDVLALSLATTL